MEIFMKTKITYTPEQKIRIYKYVDEHREEIYKYNSVWKKTHSHIVNATRMKSYYLKKAYDYEANAKIFRKILL